MNQDTKKMQAQKLLRKILFICGILSSLLYFAMNIFVPPLFEGYSSASQTVSELSAIGALTRPIWLPLGLVYTLLFTAFGFGVRRSARQNHRLRIVANLIIFYGVISLAWPFAPMHLRGAAMALTDIIHIILGSVTVLLMIIIIGFGIAAFGKAFRIYSITSFVILIVSGVMTGIDAPNLAKNLPTPWLGVWERIFIYVFLLWVAVLATILLCGEKRMKAL